MKSSDDLRWEDLFEQEKKGFIFVYKFSSNKSNRDNILDTENIPFIFK